MSQKKNTGQCQECGQWLLGAKSKHTHDDCMAYKREQLKKGLEKAKLVVLEDTAFLNIPLEFPRAWLVFKATVEKRGSTE